MFDWVIGTINFDAPVLGSTGNLPGVLEIASVPSIQIRVAALQGLFTVNGIR
jgi:hypothetical protein